MFKSRPPFDNLISEAENPCPVSCKLILVFPSVDADKCPQVRLPVEVIPPENVLAPVTSIPAPTSRLPAIVVVPSDAMANLFTAASASLIANVPFRFCT